MDTENANVGDKDCYKDPMDAVGFLYRTMVERDPSKRKVKPVDKPLQLLDFGDLDDSSDDSDFKIGDHEQESDNDDSGESSAGNEDNSEEEEEEASAAVAPVPSVPVEPTPAEVPEVKEEVPPGGEPSAKGLKVSVGQLIERAMARQTTAKQRISDISTKKLKVQICSVCLGDISLFSKTVARQGGDKMNGEEEDEIVECDCCGVSVHEGCYGISDAETAVSTVSSSSTEPWFCDACKAGNMAPACELCPNAGGIFKETDVGKWVHLVCALYIPGVAFGDVDKLTPVTLFEMPYSRWGAKSCALCEDDRYSRTGVCIKCDAGMCRTYFHVTCAQREGLLSEASTEEDIADPFFAYCKLHSDKNISRSKRRNYLALQSQSKEKKLGEKPSSDEKARIERKLAWHRDKYLSAKEKRPQPWVPTQKMPRLLTTSPSACKKLLKKAELLGLSPQTHLPGAESMMDIRRKWHVPPAFSVEFVGYYLDRNNRMVSMQRRLDELLQQNSQLQEQEQNLREQYEKVVSEVETLRKENTDLHDRGMEYWKVMCDVSSKKYPLPDVLKPKRLCKSPNRSKRSDASGSVIMECGICHKSHDQHQLAKCDSCQLHYHLACLDPPLSRMPKKTKSQGWQCSECDKTEEDDHEEDVDPDAPRKLRVHAKGSGSKCSPGSEKGRRGRSRKRLPEDNTSVDEKTSETCISSGAEEKPETEASPRLTVVVRRARRSTELSYRKSKRRGTKRKSNQGSWTEDDEKTNEELEAKIPRHSTRRVSIDKDIKVECCRCNESGEPANLVKCDECQRSFHFHCLNPPVRKTPKQRGYTWHCEDCDPTEDDELKDSTMDTEGVPTNAETEAKEEKEDSNPVYTVE